MLIEESRLRRIVAEILRHAGSDDQEARLVADHLVDANLAGHDSHGVGMIPKYVENVHGRLVTPNEPATLVRDDGAVLLFDGGRGYGQRVCREAMIAGIARCRDTGVALLMVRAAHHIGRVGAYGEQSIAAGLVSVHFVNVTDHLPLVAPFGGREARYSTNPFCVAIPGTPKTEPILLDMATSRIAFGKVKVAYNRGTSVPEGSLVAPDGSPTVDPACMFHEPRGALLPVGVHKGSGLALACELLAGTLSGWGTMQPGTPRLGGIVNNMLTVIIDPARLVDTTWLHAEIDAMVAYVKSSEPVEAGTPVLVAGEPERLSREARRRDGIPMDDTTWEEILAAAESLGVSRERVSGMLG
jgi:uncharacterized oxidoreductase